MEDVIVIKLGGIAAKKLNPEFMETLKTWKAAGKKIVIVHGGGYLIDELMSMRQLEVQKIDGLRVTTPKTVACVDKALREMMGPKLSKNLNQAGIEALQINQGLDRIVEADFLNQSVYGYVGQVTNIKTAYLCQIMEDGLIPILPSLGMTRDGQILNINADDVASHIAVALQADELIMMTDVPGVKEVGAVLSQLTVADVFAKIKTGVITGNMIPKVQGAIQAVEAGVGRVCIGQMLKGGTRILREV